MTSNFNFYIELALIQIDFLALALSSVFGRAGGRLCAQKKYIHRRQVIRYKNFALSPTVCRFLVLPLVANAAASVLAKRLQLFSAAALHAEKRAP
ncbi:hypothetical protein [Flavobacterium sp.]|uniref:hypothetical protein n=1 Tax=Flavobacterium sp. TaxID=239 RepID=UPI003B9960B4